MSIVAQENLLQPSLRANSFRLLTLYTIRIRVCSTTSPARFKQFVRCLEEGGEKVIYIDRIEMTQQVTIHFPHPPSSQRKSKESHLFTKTLLYISSAHFSSDGYLWPTAVLSHRDNSGGQGASIVGAQHPICGISGTLDWNGGLAIYPNRIQKSMDVNQSRDYIRRPRKMPSRH